MPKQLVPIDVFKEPSIARLTSVLTELTTHLLALPTLSDDELPHAVLKFLCTKHPQLSNYPIVIDLQLERDALARELDILRRKVRLLLDDRRRAHNLHDDITI